MGVLCKNIGCKMYRKIILICFVKTVSSLTCEEVLELPESKRLTLSELQTLKPSDIKGCLYHLGEKNLTYSEADFIWKSLLEFYNNVEDMPEEILISLRYVVIAIEPEYYANMTFDSIDIVSNFGVNYGLSGAQLAAIADRVREDFGFKQPENYTFLDLTALRQILCAFYKSEVIRIHPKAYKEAAMVIGELKNCNYEVMEGFAYLAVQSDAFGNPGSWTKETVEEVGNVAWYLPKGDKSKLETRLGTVIRRN